MHRKRMYREIIGISIILLAAIGLAEGIYDPSNVGIKTKNYHHDPIIASTYDQGEEIAPQQTVTYHRTTTIERLSPEQSSAGNGGTYGSTSYNSGHNVNEYQQYPLQSKQQHQQQNRQQHQQQQQRQGSSYYPENDRQQEIPLYQQNTATHTVSSNWNDAENAITEYYTGCPTGHTGQLPYAYDCRRFINCWHGRGHIQSCGAGTVFNPETLECDRPDKVICDALGALGETAQAHSQSDYQQQQQQQQQTESVKYRAGRLVDATSENIDLLCPQGLSGLQPHPHNCSKFINCANGNVHVQECGPGTAYSIPMMVCDYKHKVDCSDREYTDGSGLLDIRMDRYGGAAFEHKDNDVECAPDESGLFPHPYDCTKFLNCANGNTFIQNCGPGTAFDSVNKVCGHTKDHCTDHTPTHDGGSGGHGINTPDRRDHTISMNFRQNGHNAYTGVDILCPAGVTGLFVHPFDYTNFLHCRNGNTAVQNCIAGTVFSIANGFCVPKDQIAFADHVSYIVSEVSYEQSKMLMSCPPGTEGFHLFPYDCTKYIHCSTDGRMLIQDCAPNFVFSIAKRKCLPKQEVQSYARVKYLYELGPGTSASQTNNGLIHTDVKAFQTQTGNGNGSRMIECPVKLSGLFPYPFDSIKYVICREGQLNIETCASGTAFSLSKRKCLLRDSLEPKDMVLFHREFAEEWSTEIGYGYGYTPGKLYLVCPSNVDDGVFLHPFDGTKYIHCHKGTTIVESCIDGTVFSLSREECLMPNQVDAHDRVDSYTDMRKEFSVGSVYDSNQHVACPPGVGGMHPHPSDCTKFLNCANGATHVQSCGPGAAWSQDMEICVLKDNVDCSGNSFNTRNKEQEEDYHKAKAFNEDSQIIRPSSKIECPADITAGHYPYPFDYTKFFSCRRGQNTIERCSEGMIFSISRRYCEILSQVDGSDRVILLKDIIAEVDARSVFTTCPAKVDGVYVYPFDCAKYIRCQYGHTFIENCYAGSVFSMSHAVCMPESQVERQDRVASITETNREERYWQTNQENTAAYMSSSQLKSAVCPPGASGMQPHPHDCTKFLNCMHGETHVQSCGPGTAWSKDMEVCELRDKIDCTGRMDYAWESGNAETGFNELASATTDIVCPTNIGEGFYPHPFDSTKYFICQNGQSLVGHCSRNYVFSITRRMCDDPERVLDTDRVRFFREFVADNPPEYDFVTCPAKAVGDFLYPFDCQKFIKCNRGLTSIEVCADETVFSLSNRNCLAKARLGRMDRVAFVDETQNDWYYRQNDEANTLILCPMGFSGPFQHPSDWTKYLDCANGQAVVKMCPIDSVFSVSRGKCDVEVNISLDDRCHNDQRTSLRKDGFSHGQNAAVQSAIGVERSSPKCPAGANGMFSHPFDCAKFLNCANGVTHIQSCGPGTLWSAQKKLCDFQHKVECRNGGDAAAGKTSAALAQGPSVKCPAAALGLLPHPFDCTKFLNCANGETHVQACGPGTAWNRDIRVCDFIANVDCSNLESSFYNNNRDLKSYGGNIRTTNQWNHGGQGHGNNDRHRYVGQNSGTTTSTTYTDRWSNMNMQRPDANANGHGSGAVNSGTWPATGAANSVHDGVYRQSAHNRYPPTTRTVADTNWSARGSSADRLAPGQNVLYMEGSLEPNRNYVNTFHTYKAPLAPLSPNIATTTTMPIGTTKVYYAQPADSEESIDEPYGHSGGGSAPYPLPLPIPDRQNHSRNINHISSSNSRAPIVRHEDTHEIHSAQQPNPLLLPPLNAPTGNPPYGQSINTPHTDLLPPSQGFDRGQVPQHLDNRFHDRGQVDITSYDQAASGSVNKPVISNPQPASQTNIFDGLQPPSVSTNSRPFSPHPYEQISPTTKLTPMAPFDDTNLYGGLHPPSANTSPMPITQTDYNENVRVYQIYPPMRNATVKTHGDPHYSSPYSGVTHSRNATWQNPHRNNSNASNGYPSANSKLKVHDVTSPQASEMATDFVDTSLPMGDALHMLLRPYFNRSGTIDEDSAKQSESHIMQLVQSKSSSTTPSSISVPRTAVLPTISSATPPTAFVHDAHGPNEQKQTDEDAELILAGEQHHLVNVSSRNATHDVRPELTEHTTQENSNHPNNWQKGINHSREFHLRHPNLPSPFTTTTHPKQTDLAGEKQLPPHHSHSHNHHSPQHHHSRDFHLRHPQMPNPFVTREGDKSITPAESLDIPNPYAEPTTPKTVFSPRISATNGDCQYDCGNGKCVKQFEVCDGVNNCGNRKDESKCDHLGYDVRLTGGDSPHMGRIEVKIREKWGYVCDDKFGLRDADVVCHELGFKLGASEVRGNSFYPPLEVNFAYVMDEVECHGNETSLKDCNFKGWGIHNCGPDEVVGVVCKVPLFKCPNNYWLCSTSKECIPPAFVCDNTPDCADQSDESEKVCKSTIEYRLEGGRNSNEGRLEVKYRGEWGTVCDDDFGLKEAQVACNSLGYYGRPQIEKNIYGPGSGPIWLDQVSCLSNETSIDKCNHWTWGEHNCNHTEDVGLRCTAGPPPRHLLNKGQKREDVDDGQYESPFDDTEFYQNSLERSSKFLRAQTNCGRFKSNIFDEYAHPEERVVNGSVAKRGRHPWQATIRTRGRGGISSHWCGAVLIGDGNARQSSHLLTAAHCLAGYQKGAYFIRMGDHYANIAESSEIDSYIENWYIHEKFRDQTHMNNDIALIVLKNPVRFNDYVQPVCLPEKDASLEPERQCTISGWGSIKSGISTPSNILRAAQVPILPDGTCKQSHVYGNSLTEGMFCAGSMDESVDACDGDSGGPLVCSDNDAETLYGIISWGQHCGYANKPGVYVRIANYIDWIYSKINFSLQQNGKTH